MTGAPTVTTDATTASQPGTYPIVIAQGNLAAPNYIFNLVNGTMTVLPAGSYTISASPNRLTIPAGQNRQTTLTLTTSNLYQGTVTLGCGSLPANVSCVFSPSTYTFTGTNNISGGANPAVGTLTVNTLGGQPVVGALSSSEPHVLSAAICIVPGTLAVVLIAFRRRKAMTHLRGYSLLLCLALAAAFLGLDSCGGGSTGPALAKPGSFTLTISGTGTTPFGTGAVSQSLNLSVTIQ